MPCDLVVKTKVFEECAASIFRLENGGCRFLQNAGIFMFLSLHVMTSKISIIIRVLPVLNFFSVSVFGIMTFFTI